MLTQADMVELEHLVDQETKAQTSLDLFNMNEDANYFFDKVKIELSKAITGIHLRKLDIYKKISDYEDERIREIEKAKHEENPSTNQSN